MGILDRLFSSNKQPKSAGQTVSQKPVEIRARVSSAKQLFMKDGKSVWEDTSGITVRSDGIVFGNRLILYEQILEVKVPSVILGVDPTVGNSPKSDSFNFQAGEGPLALLWQWPDRPRPSQAILLIKNVDSVFAEIERAMGEAKNASGAA